MIDVLVIGCGLSGIVVARELAEQGFKVHILEKRNHVGGNIYDCRSNGGGVSSEIWSSCIFYR